MFRPLNNFILHFSSQRNEKRTVAANSNQEIAMVLRNAVAYFGDSLGFNFSLFAGSGQFSIHLSF